MSRKISLILILIASQIWITPANAVNEKAIQVIINDKVINLEVPPVQENGRVLVPVRAIMEELGAEVSYSQTTGEIIITLIDMVIHMAVNDRVVKINSIDEYLDVAPKLFNGRVLVPLRFVGEYLGFDITWNADNRIVSIQDRGEAYNWLSSIYLRLYNVPFLPNALYKPNFLSYDPMWSKPFSFSGQFDLHISNEGDVSEINGGRTGRFIDGTFTYLTTGTLNNSGEISYIRNEVVQDTVKHATYRNQGAGWSRYTLHDDHELDVLSGSQEYLLSFLLLNYESVEIRSQYIDGRSKLVFAIVANENNVLDDSPLNRILDTYLEKSTYSYYYNEPDMNAIASMVVDAESLRIESSDVSFSLRDLQLTGTYIAHFDYTYKEIVQIDEIIVANTGLELLNEAIRQDFETNFSFSGELLPYSIQTEGTINKNLKAYVKLLYGKELYQEYYKEWSKGIRKFRNPINNIWEDDDGSNEIFYYSGNKLAILEFLNNHMIVPSANTVLISGKEKTTLEFQFEASEMQIVDQLRYSVLNTYDYMGSWEATGKASFVFVIDVESKFIESMITTVSLTDSEQTDTFIQTYQFFADQLRDIPDID